MEQLKIWEPHAYSILDYIQCKPTFSNKEKADILNLLGEWQTQKGKYLEAKQLLDQALTLREDLFKEDHLEVIISLNNLYSGHLSQS